MAFDKKARAPLHISQILERIRTQFGVDIDRESLVSSLSKKWPATPASSARAQTTGSDRGRLQRFATDFLAGVGGRARYRLCGAPQVAPPCSSPFLPRLDHAAPQRNGRATRTACHN